MSVVLQFGGRGYVAGLYWTQPGTEEDRESRRERAWTVEWGDQTGWVPKEAGLRGVDGVPSLAASVAAYLGGVGGDGPEGGWVALLQADDGRFALVRARDGAIVAGGDEVFDDAVTALDSLAGARADGADVYGTSGVVTDGSLVVEMDVAALPEDGREAGLKRAGGGGSPARVAALAGLLIVLAVGGVWLLAPDMLLGLFGGAKETAPMVAEQEDRPVFARIDSAALVQECGAAQVDWPPYLPAWQLRSIECHGWFGEVDVIALRPELEGRAVMVVRWDLPGQYVAAVHRRIAEEHLDGWFLGSVVERSAWAVVPLGSVLERSEGQGFPSYLEFRRDVDRHLGMQGGQIDYGGDAHVVTVTVVLGHGLGRIASLVDDIPGFELVSLSRGAGGEWVLSARSLTGVQVAESIFQRLDGKARRGEAVFF